MPPRSCHDRLPLNTSVLCSNRLWSYICVHRGRCSVIFWFWNVQSWYLGNSGFVEWIRIDICFCALGGGGGGCREWGRVRVIPLSGRAPASLGSVNSTSGQRGICIISSPDDPYRTGVYLVPCWCALCTSGSGMTCGNLLPSRGIMC